MDCLLVNLKLHSQIAPKDAAFKTLDMSSDVGLRLQQMSLIHLHRLADLFVWVDDVLSISLHHQQGFAKGAATLAQDVIGVHRDDGAQ